MALSLLKPSPTHLFLLIALFYLGWSKFLTQGTDVYLIDYAQRLAIIVIGWAALKEACSPYIKPVPLPVLLFTILGAATIMTIDSLSADMPVRMVFDTLLYKDIGFPEIPNPTWVKLDLAFGLLLVAVSEELVFRKVWADWAAERGQTEYDLYAGSAVAFGLLHLPQGLADTAMACLWGVLLMWVYRRSASLPLAIAVHYLADIWYFA
ncbi:MAG: CPBP family intramembrane glutamic endopeptidase [Rhodospirillaceae bacterium]